jgi:predicted esterase
MKRLVVVLCLLLAVSLFAADKQSWKQIADKAIRDGDMAKATTYYEKWVEADPTDATSLYNLACCYSIGGKLDSAMTALNLAVSAGWSDSVHTLMDQDLAPLHKRPEFRKALENAARNERVKSSAYVSHTCEQNRMGRYVVVLPDEYDPRQTYPLVLMLHNYGGSPEDFSKVTELINRHDFIYAISEASYAIFEEGDHGFSHLREMQNFAEDTASLRDAADWVIRVADDMKKRYPVAGDKFSVVGFSQGAMLAHVIAAYYPERVSKVCAHGGYMQRGTISLKQLEKEKAAGVKTYITHGKEDQSVRMEEAIYVNNMLKQSGNTVSFEMVAGGHNFTPEVGGKVNDWLLAK